jgi:hypothetical protein
VENLGNALKEVQKTRDLNDIKCDLNTYRIYCERAADMLDEAEDKAPGAARLVKRGLPIIDKRIRQILADIQQRANTACKQSKGTPTEELACKINQEVQKWQISDQEQMTQNVNNLIFILKAKIPPYLANKEIYENIEKIGKEKDLIKQYQSIMILIALIPQRHCWVQSHKGTKPAMKIPGYLSVTPIPWVVVSHFYSTFNSQVLGR